MAICLFLFDVYHEMQLLSVFSIALTLVCLVLVHDLNAEVTQLKQTLSIIGSQTPSNGILNTIGVRTSQYLSKLPEKGERVLDYHQT